MCSSCQSRGQWYCALLEHKNIATQEHHVNSCPGHTRGQSVSLRHALGARMGKSCRFQTTLFRAFGSKETFGPTFSGASYACCPAGGWARRSCFVAVEGRTESPSKLVKIRATDGLSRDRTQRWSSLPIRAQYLMPQQTCRSKTSESITWICHHLGNRASKAISVSSGGNIHWLAQHLNRQTPITHLGDQGATCGKYILALSDILISDLRGDSSLALALGPMMGMMGRGLHKKTS